MSTVQHSRLACYGANGHGYIWWQHQFCLSLVSNDLLWEASDATKRCCNKKANHIADTENVSRKETPLAEMHTSMCLLFLPTAVPAEVGKKKQMLSLNMLFSMFNINKSIEAFPRNRVLKVKVLFVIRHPFLCLLRFYFCFSVTFTYAPPVWPGEKHIM